MKNIRFELFDVMFPEKDFLSCTIQNIQAMDLKEKSLFLIFFFIPH